MSLSHWIYYVLVVWGHVGRCRWTEKLHGKKRKGPTANISTFPVPIERRSELIECLEPSGLGTQRRQGGPRRTWTAAVTPVAPLERISVNELESALDRAIAGDKRSGKHIGKRSGAKVRRERESLVWKTLFRFHFLLITQGEVKRLQRGIG